MTRFIIVRNGETRRSADSYDAALEVAKEEAGTFPVHEPVGVYQLVAELKAEITVVCVVGT